LHQILKLPFDKFLFRRYVTQSIPPNSKHSVAIFKRTDTVPTPCNEIELFENPRFLIKKKKKQKKNETKNRDLKRNKNFMGRKKKT